MNLTILALMNLAISEQLARAALNPVKAGTSVCRHSVPTDRKCLDCAVLDGRDEKGKGA